LAYLSSAGFRSDEVELDEKDFQNSAKAFDWLVTRFKEDEERE